MVEGGFREYRFVLDVHLGKLARYLRILGIDSLWSQFYKDPELLEISSSQKRILLTRDRALFNSAISETAHYVRSVIPQLQLQEVLDRFSLRTHTELTDQILTRCLECNTLLDLIGPDSVQGLIPEEILIRYTEFFRCPTCKRIYWKGTHYARMWNWALNQLKGVNF